MKKITLSVSLIVLLFVGYAHAIFDGVKGECISGNCVNGKGTMMYSFVAKYSGQWRNAKKNGYGTFIWGNSFEYVGQFKDDQFNGKGTMTYSNGSKYIGQWEKDKKNGLGTLTSNIYGRTSKYVGQWKDGEMYTGKDVFTYFDGSKLIIEYKDGQCIKKTEYNPNGSIKQTEDKETQEKKELGENNKSPQDKMKNGLTRKEYEELSVKIRDCPLGTIVTMRDWKQYIRVKGNFPNGVFADYSKTSCWLLIDEKWEKVDKSWMNSLSEEYRDRLENALAGTITESWDDDTTPDPLHGARYIKIGQDDWRRISE